MALRATLRKELSEHFYNCSEVVSFPCPTSCSRQPEQVAIDQPGGKHAEVKRQTKARRFMGGRISFSFAKNKKKIKK